MGLEVGREMVGDGGKVNGYRVCFSYIGGLCLWSCSESVCYGMICMSRQEHTCVVS